MKSINAARALPPPLVRYLRRHVLGPVLIYLGAPERRQLNAKRDAQIRRARRAGASVPALAKKHNLSEARVWEICADLHPDRRSRRGGNHDR